ncbi:hypothetical protein GCM10009411_20330 [Shewanella litoralis]|uniref:DUF2547 family protein n=2 Tax=Shewanella litoralis TaxID=2282700 RepID=A0ABQ2RCR7_9GAMM|nr:hypothetical protein GCM10009411_20330 [Shewanella litoralis]
MVNQFKLACVLSMLMLSLAVNAGTVVVRKSSEPFNAFAVRDEVLLQHEWQELIKQQQQLNILQSLPLNCISVAVTYLYFQCGQQHYRPYQYQNQQLFIEIDPYQRNPSLPK